jgi:hypothetical protein
MNEQEEQLVLSATGGIASQSTAAQPIIQAGLLSC